MDNVLIVRVLQALHRLEQRILAEAFRIVSLEFLTDLGERATIHEFEEDPQSSLEIISLMTLDDRLVTAELHDTNFVHYAISLIL